MLSTDYNPEKYYLVPSLWPGRSSLSLSIIFQKEIGFIKTRYYLSFSHPHVMAYLISSKHKMVTVMQQFPLLFPMVRIGKDLEFKNASLSKKNFYNIST